MELLKRELDITLQEELNSIRIRDKPISCIEFIYEFIKKFIINLIFCK